MHKVLAIFIIFTLLGCSGADESGGWPDLGVIKGGNELRKELIAECCFRGGVRQIQVGDYLPGEKLEVAILGQTGILFLRYLGSE